ncbi:PucR family transcriptional regulator [Anaerosacchariphilus polymeriproducens]|uniref:PucR family transcriptional regulator n=1 Tax=Anaerosacchariphilus polymeriproducens TaxID=1812858 RepID=A0A371AZN7_9FIRM|nr:PucR family transcriptional regulator [Anaerosacchariphilus polymeriproducens]RDU25055.1 PucR family transcriptional regulator [Anaerosacchariphilus polymeriproducens]
MFNVASLFQFDFFSKFTIIAGESGLNRNISNVVILEYEEFEHNYSGFHEGDFVLTSLFYAKDNPNLIQSSFSRLMDIGVCAIAVKSVYYTELPKEIIALADNKKVPIFLFHSIYMEDLILNISDYIRSTRQFDYYEKNLDQLLKENPAPEAITSFIKDVNMEFNSYITSMYLEYKDTIDSITFGRDFNNLLYRKSQLQNTNQFFCMKYKNGLLFLYHYKEPMDSDTVLNNWHWIIRDLSLVREQFNIGVTEQVLPINKADISIRQSLYTIHASSKDNVNYDKYGDIGIYNIILPLKENRYAFHYLQLKYKKLKNYDNKHGKCLIQTLEQYVSQNHQIDTTAKILFQHPNTIRYRIQKIKSILGCKNDFEFEVVSTFMIKAIHDTNYEYN